MQFLTMTDEQAYMTAKEIANAERAYLNGSTVITGDHPVYGALKIVIPSIGESIVFGDAFKAEPLVIQLNASFSQNNSDDDDDE